MEKNAFYWCKNIKKVIISTNIDDANALYLLMQSAAKKQSPSKIINYNDRFIQIATTFNFFRKIARYTYAPKPNKLIFDTFKNKKGVEIVYDITCKINKAKV